MSDAKTSSQPAATPSQVNWATIRRWERYRIELRFKATMTKEGKRIVLFGQGTDVSEGGMAAYIPTDLAASDVVELELSLPYLTGQQPFRIRALVRNRNGFRYGLEYTTLASADREMLLKCMRALSLTQ